MRPSQKEAERAARLERDVALLRQVAHLITPPSDGSPRPSKTQALYGYVTFLVTVQTAPQGPCSPSRALVENLVALSARYGPRLFNCYRDARIPASTNQLEGFFNVTKRQMRKALGSGPTALAPVHHLDADWLLALHQLKTPLRPEPTMALDPTKYQQARAAQRQREQPAVQRRSWVRSLTKHLRRLLHRWAQSESS